MTTVNLTLQIPESLAEQADKSGLLAPQAIERLLRDELRREAGRRLVGMSDKLASLDGPAPTLDEIQGEVAHVRSQRKGAHEGGA